MIQTVVLSLYLFAKSHSAYIDIETSSKLADRIDGRAEQVLQWYTKMQEAKSLAHREHRHILLNFSGSDWCGPCILLRKDIFDARDFAALADTALVLLNADFPRLKKNQLPKEQQALNDRLADQYNAKGQFPLTLLLTEDGKVLQQWEGNPSVPPAAFAARVKAAIDADR